MTLTASDWAALLICAALILGGIWLVVEVVSGLLNSAKEAARDVLGTSTAADRQRIRELEQRVQDLETKRP